MMRLSVAVAVLGALAALAGGYLIGRWALGLVLVAEGACAVAWALARDFPERPARPSVTALDRVLERSRAS